MGLTLVIDEIITEERTYKYNKTLQVTDPNKAEVTEAYFAIKQIKYLEKESEETFSYTFKNKTSVKAQKDKTKIADKIRGKLKFDGDKKYTKNKQIIAGFTKDVYEAKESMTIKALKKEKRTYYLKVNAGSMGNQMYLIVETKSLKGKKVKLKIHENEKELKLLKSKEAILPVLVYAKKEDKTTDTEASDWIELNIETVKAKDAGVGFYISDDGQDKEVGIKKIQFRPKKDKMASKTEDASKSFEGWAEKLYIREDESADGEKSEKQKAEEARTAEVFVPIVKDDSATKVSYPKKISGSKNIEVGKVAKYSLDEYKYKQTTGREDDKKNILWSLHIKGDKTSKYTVINTKSKANLYTYAKMEIVGGKNKLSIVFDKALKGKKIQIEPYRNKPDIDQSKKVGGYDYIKSTTIKAEAPSKITKLDTTKLWLETECDDCTKKDKEFLNGSFFKLKTPDTIHVYSDGKINKLMMEKLLSIRYVFVASDGEEHDLGTTKIHKTKRHIKKNKLSTAKNDDIYLVYAKSIKSYSKGIVKFGFKTWNSSSGRWYINPYCFAGLLGAMIEESIEDLGFNGFSIKDGNTAGGSSSHINGEKGDLRYLNTKKDGRRTILQDKTFDYNRQVKFNNALYKFGWGRTSKMYSENFNHKVNNVLQNTLLPHTKHMKKTTGSSRYRHHHHLHLTGFDFSLLK